MNFELLRELLEELHFRQAVWLLLPAFTLHVLEEAPQFTAWVNRHASPRFTRTDFLRNNGLGMALNLLLCSAVAVFPHLAVVFVFFALGVWQAGFNILFHVATTAAYGVYSPGLLLGGVIHAYVVAAQVHFFKPFGRARAGERGSP